MPTVTRRRAHILGEARRLLGGGAKPSVERIAAAAGISKTAFYREFSSRAALLEALRLEPEAGARERILASALEMVGVAGLSAMSMDELAVRAGVSRATLYRLYPGKAALFIGLVHAYSPLESVSHTAIAMQDQPPEVVMPELARTAYRVIAGPGAPGIGLLRTVFLEVSSVSPEAEAASRDTAATMLGSVGRYVIAQMAAGRLRPMPPVLALQSFIGPIFFHLMTRPLIDRTLGFEMDGEEAVTTLAESWLRAMKPDPTQGEAHE